MPAIAELDDQGRVQGVYDMDSYIQRASRIFVRDMEKVFTKHGMSEHASVMADLSQYIEKVMEEGK